MMDQVIGNNLVREKMPKAESILHDVPMKDTPEVLYRTLIRYSRSQALTV